MKLKKSPNKVVGGICGIDPLIVRVVFATALVFPISRTFTIILYSILTISMEEK